MLSSNQINVRTGKLKLEYLFFGRLKAEQWMTSSANESRESLHDLKYLLLKGNLNEYYYGDLYENAYALCVVHDADEEDYYAHDQLAPAVTYEGPTLVNSSFLSGMWPLGDSNKLTNQEMYITALAVFALIGIILSCCVICSIFLSCCVCVWGGSRYFYNRNIRPNSVELLESVVTNSRMNESEPVFWRGNSTASNYTEWHRSDSDNFFDGASFVASISSRTLNQSESPAAPYLNVPEHIAVSAGTRSDIGLPQ